MVTFNRLLLHFKFIFIFAVLALFAKADDLRPGIIYDMGGKYDHSFNQSAAEGVPKFVKETGIKCHEFELGNEAQRTQYMRQLIRHGVNIIAAIGFNQASAVEEMAREYPNIKFVIVDGIVDLPNVESVNYKEHQSSYLCGMAAALASKTHKVGFVGGMDIPLIRKFALGYTAGVHAIDPSTQVIVNMTGTTPSAWNDPIRGGELAKTQFGQGVDVVFHAAGSTGIGVMQAAKDAGLLSIGCDKNQDGVHPGSVLTSCIKRVDVAVFNSFMEAKNNTWKGGLKQLGLECNAVDYSLDEYNRSLITPSMEARLNQAKLDIVSGKISVPEYK
jgi:basic membrane protein A